MNNFFNFIIKASLVLTVFLVPLLWSPWIVESLEFPKQYALLFFVLIGVTAWLLKMVFLEREVRLKRTPLNLPVLLFALVAIFSAAFSADTLSFVFGQYGRFSDGLIGLLSVVGLYFLLINTARTPASLLTPFMLSAALSVTIGYLSFFGIFWQAGFNTVSLSPQGFAMFLAFLVSFLTLLSVRAETRLLPWAGTLLLLFSSFGLLLLLNEPSAFAVLLFGLFLVLLSGMFQRVLTGQAPRLRRLWFPALLSLLVVLMLFSAVKIPGIPADGAKEPRLSHSLSWSIAVSTITESTKNLVLGSGPGTFGIDFSKHRPAGFNKTDFWQTRFAQSGSHLSGLLATTGILGFLTYLGLLFWFLLVSLVFVKDKRNYPFAAGTLVLFFTHLLSPQTTVSQVVFWLFLGFSTISWETPAKEFRFSLKKALKFALAARILSFAAVLGAGTLFFFGARFFAADVKYAASQNIPNPSLQIEKVLESSRLNPWQAEYRTALSRLYLQEALNELRKPEDSRNQEQLSQDMRFSIAYARGDTVENVKITGATELGPNRVASWETLGTVYKNLAFAKGALEWGILSFETAISLEPSNPVLYTELGKLYVVQEEFAAAREQFEKAVGLKPDYRQALVQLALLKEKEGDSLGAITALQKLDLSSPLGAEGRFQLGRLLYNEGEAEKAIVQFEKVVAALPNQSNALFALGVAYESQGRIEEAIGQFERVLQLNPDNEAVQEKLQRLQQ